MNDKVFIDTNILVYANDSSDKDKQEKAKTLIRNVLLDQSGVISIQVLSEFWVSVTKKIDVPLSEDIAQKQTEFFELMVIIDLTLSIFKSAVTIKKRNKLSYWDSLIIAAAYSAGCSTIYTEDFNHGQIIEGMTICNPFKAVS